MTFLVHLFTPETWQAFRDHGAAVTGFRDRQRRAARERVRPGDVFLCYLVRLSRWCGALEVLSEPFDDRAPIFGDPDPFTVRFRVRPLVLFEPAEALPVFAPEVWNALSFTRGQPVESLAWTGRVRASLGRIDGADGAALLGLLRAQQAARRPFPFTERDRRQLARRFTLRREGGTVDVVVPEDGEGPGGEAAPAEGPGAADLRESIAVQARVAQIGAAMGFRIWVPRGDRARVLELVHADRRAAFLDPLPLNSDETTLRTIENIDGIRLRGRAMARAFEIEHTTAIDSGLLRMADPLALQPNMSIRLHIVAPAERREKVLRELRRPVFALLDPTPLHETCSYLSCEAVQELAQSRHLAHASDSILEEYEEYVGNA